MGKKQADKIKLKFMDCWIKRRVLITFFLVFGAPAMLPKPIFRVEKGGFMFKFWNNFCGFGIS